MAKSLPDIAAQAEELLRVGTVFPFDFFPDEIVVDRYKVQVVKRFFFLSERVVTAPVSESLNVKVTHGPLFAQVTIEDFMAQVSIRVEYISNSDATRLRELIEGLVIALKQKSSLEEPDTAALISASEELGDTR